MVDVAVTGGVIRGEQQGRIARFLGIPYAAAPFGERRFAPPAPVVPWDGVRTATEYGPTVPKGDYPPQYARLLAEQVIPGEECLNLNIWAPTPLEGGRPVLVWIHGGSFMNGSGSVLEYDGTAFARDGIVCVTINYRLAADGFLYFEDDAEVGSCQSWSAGSTRRADMGAGQHRRVRRGPGQGHRRRGVGRRDERDHPAGNALGERAVHPGDRRVRRRGPHPDSGDRCQGAHLPGGIAWHRTHQGGVPRRRPCRVGAGGLGFGGGGADGTGPDQVGKSGVESAAVRTRG